MSKAEHLNKTQIIRPEGVEDYAAINRVNRLAFGQPSEGAVVDQIRENCQDVLSLVAQVSNEIVGHIFFSPAVIESNGSKLLGLGLAPLAVLPAFQNQGFGTRLVEAGLRQIAATDCPYVIVLGHEQYYPRFGFERASIHALSCQWPGVPDEAFMVKIFDESKMSGVSGVARYRSEFDQAM